jgi:AmmeMemoRadiSam system protein A
MTQRPVCESVIEAATSAASRDSRFPPLTQRELPLVQVHLSLLNEPRYLSYSGSEDLLRQLRPGVDGVVLTVGGKMATFLPKVWEQVPSKADFLELLSLKAGLDRDAWRAPGALVSVYQTEDFAEPEAPPDPLLASN